MINKKITLKVKRGFTLIETLLAILILTTAIAGPLTIAAKGLQLSLIAKDQVTATFLAQDAVEYVRFVRDTNRLSVAPDWLAGLDGGNGCVSTNGSSSCYLDSATQHPVVATVCSATCPAINYDASTNFYNYTTGTKTIFTRTVTMTTHAVGTDAVGEVDVTVTVQWKDIGGVSRSVVLRDNLLNWQ